MGAQASSSDKAFKTSSRSHTGSVPLSHLPTTATIRISLTMVDISATDDKGSIHIAEEVSPTRVDSIEEKTYTSRHTEPPVLLSTEEEKRIYRKVDLRLVPIVTLLQMLSFMDRGAVQLTCTRVVDYTDEIGQGISVCTSVALTWT